MRYLVLYLMVGVATLALTLLQSHLEKKKHGPSLSETLDELRLQEASTWQRIANKVIVPVLAGIAIICVWPVAVAFLVKDLTKPRRLKAVGEKQAFRVQEKDLIEQLSIAEIESRERVEDPLGGVPDKPFGHLWPAWNAFVNELSADATLWSFAATDDTSYEAVRLEGYVHFDESGTESIFLTAKMPLSVND